MLFLRPPLIVILALCLGSPSLMAGEQSQGTQRSASTEGTDKDEKRMENEFLWTLATPVLTHAVNKTIDWLFENVIASTKQPSPSAPADNPASTAPSYRAEVRNPVGIAYRLYRLNPDRSEVTVDPDTVFRAGDRIVVRFMTNLPGTLNVSNLDAAGQVQDLGHGYVEGGRMARIGPFEFYGTPGRDILTLNLQPCKRIGEAGESGLETLKLSYGAPSVPIDARVVDALPSCAAILNRPTQKVESLIVVDERTAYSVTNHATVEEISRPDRVYVSKIPLHHR